MGCLSASLGHAQNPNEEGAAAQVTTGQKVETKGMILTRDGENMTVQTRNMGNITVEIHPETKVQVPKGVFRHSNMEETALVPGLDIEVKGVGAADNHVVADQIRFTRESLKVAQQAHAAMTATNAQVAQSKQDIASNKEGIAANQQANQQNAAHISQHSEELAGVQQRFNDLTEYDVKKEVSVNFDTGKSNISDDAKQQLTDLAKAATGIKGYLVEVKGFASTSGNADANQQLSEDRAENVVAFLHQQGVAMQHVVNPGAMGTTSPVASNDTEAGRMQNQRVEVKLLVNRGVGGSK
ncbi:MAG TPA: OmpA family protein [Candidatus Angelobacter sp.]|nr:OmpA family protein [Candidatus Angelobacter sp.]